MRILVVLALVVGLGACKSKPRAEPEPDPSKNPYHNAMPDKLKKRRAFFRIGGRSQFVEQHQRLPGRGA